MKRAPSTTEAGRLRDALVEALDPLLVCKLNGECIHLVERAVPGLGTFIVYAERVHGEGHVQHVITVTWSGRVSLSRPDAPSIAVLVCGEFASAKPPVGAYAPFRSLGYADESQIEFSSASLLPALRRHLSINPNFMLGIWVIPKNAKNADLPRPGESPRRAHVELAA